MLSVSRLLETRIALDPASPAVTGVRRVAVLGDSFVFGQGVGPSQTLPVFLQYALNETCISDIFEVINFGVCGYNICNDWAEFNRTGLAPTFDRIVLVLCVNDAQLFH